MKVHIGKSSIHGNGVIASQDIKRGEIAFIIKGKLVKWKVVDQKTSLYGPNWIGIGKDEWIDPIGLSPLLNHSCDPSCGIKGRVTVVALKNIKRGEEITIDYSITEMDKLWYMKCFCGSPQCRKMIRSIEFLPERVFNKYIPYVPRAFQKFYYQKQ